MLNDLVPGPIEMNVPCSRLFGDIYYWGSTIGVVVSRHIFNGKEESHKNDPPPELKLIETLYPSARPV
jgi:hypothetical protein